MPEPRNPLADVLSLLTQPATAVAGFFEALQSFRTTMEHLNGMAVRMNRLLEDVEEPIRTLAPQLTKAAQRADRLMDTVAEPLDRLTPQLVRLSDTLASPALRDLPREVTAIVTALSDLPKQLAPLARMAQTAGSLFGFRGLTELPQQPAIKAAQQQPAIKKTPAKKTPAKKTAAKKKSAPPRALAARTSATFARAAARRPS